MFEASLAEARQLESAGDDVGLYGDGDASIDQPSWPPIVLIFAPALRSAQVQVLLKEIAPRSRVLIACNCIDAAAMLAVGHVDILLMDLQCEPAQPLATIHLLARLAPGAKVMAFGEWTFPTPLHPYRALDWARLERLLAASLVLWQARRDSTPHRIGSRKVSD